MEPIAFQDEIPDNHCWGCGSLNPHGLQIKSYWDGDEAVCHWKPKPEHMAGPTHILNGGVIATIFDCHCILTAAAAAYRKQGRSVSSLPLIWYVTGSLHVDYFKPTPIDETVELRSQIKEMKEKKTVVTCDLFSQGEKCASAEVVAIRVPPAWREA